MENFSVYTEQWEIMHCEDDNLWGSGRQFINQLETSPEYTYM